MLLLQSLIVIFICHFVSNWSVLGNLRYWLTLRTDRHTVPSVAEKTVLTDNLCSKSEACTYLLCHARLSKLQIVLDIIFQGQPLPVLLLVCPCLYILPTVAAVSNLVLSSLFKFSLSFPSLWSLKICFLTCSGTTLLPKATEQTAPHAESQPQAQSILVQGIQVYLFILNWCCTWGLYYTLY